jgi:lysozyme
MNISQTGIKLIKRFEGCRLTAYKDAVGVLTIGYGHTGDVRSGETITQAQADKLLAADVAKFAKGVATLIKVPINQNKFDALVSFAYNCGLGALKTSTLLSLVNKKDFKGAANEFEKWTHAGGKVLKGLVSRRKAEKALFLKAVPVSHPYPGHLIKKGSKGKYVGMVQKKVGVKVDEDFGHLTEKGVKTWQKEHGLVDDGIVGKNTWNKMF